jgi:group I intron endonuclease
MSYGYIYKTTNLVNQNVYIGQHKGSFDPTYFGSGLLIRRALKKYGIEKFKVEILTMCESKPVLNIMEKVFISRYHSLFPNENMYNIAEGGMGGDTQPNGHRENCKCICCKTKRGETKGINHWSYGKPIEDMPMYGKHHSNETIMKMSNIKLGKIFSLEHLKNLSISHLGQVSTRKGRTIEEIYGIERAKELREKSRLGNLGRISPMKGKKHRLESILKRTETRRRNKNGKY